MMIANRTPSTNTTRQGILYLHGAPSQFGPAIAKALDLASEKDLLEVDICIDGIRSILHKKPVYRIAYTVAVSGEKTPEPAKTYTSALEWFYSWFSSPGSVS